MPLPASRTFAADEAMASDQPHGNLDSVIRCESACYQGTLVEFTFDEDFASQTGEIFYCRRPLCLNWPLASTNRLQAKTGAYGTESLPSAAGKPIQPRADWHHPDGDLRITDAARIVSLPRLYILYLTYYDLAGSITTQITGRFIYRGKRLFVMG